ncbi:ATPase, T2SS/T4P/T4SS family [Escherichia coli]
MRLDPDAILNGEIRDHDIGISSNQSLDDRPPSADTLHANDALNIIERLEMEKIAFRPG